jgi:hypothetical protein
MRKTLNARPHQVKRKRKPASEGYAFMFHGSYSAKDKAEAKARRRGGFLISRVPRGMKKRRYIVLTERVPF